MSNSLVTETGSALHRGVRQITLHAVPPANPWFGAEFEIVFVRPNGSEVVVDGYFDGGDIFRARAYCDAVGRWNWRSRSNVAGLDGQSGEFQVVPSELPGKLRIHPDDPHQFAYDNGDWFLHIGDTGYRYVVDTEPAWQVYINQAVRMGATKIRVWFCRGRSDVRALFSDDRRAMNLPYWQEIDRRVTYALNRYPQVMLQLIPYGEDTEEIQRYEVGDEASRLVARYAQARFSGLPNVFWCITNDRRIIVDEEQEPGKNKVYAGTIDQMGRDMAAREPWGTLLTNHQCRWSGYDFVDADWSDMITLEDLDQVDGALLLDYRARRAVPVINDEDRYETYRPPQHPRYFFRRLMWASLLSGGHATYGGGPTFLPYELDEANGARGYYDSVRAGKLQGGAHDFVYIHQFFSDTGLTLVGMQPGDEMVGGRPRTLKCAHDDCTIIIYHANPSGGVDGTSVPESDYDSESTPSVDVQLPAERWEIKWYDPSRGAWYEVGAVSGGRQRFTAPGGGDWVLLLQALPQ